MSISFEKPKTPFRVSVPVLEAMAFIAFIALIAN